MPGTLIFSDAHIGSRTAPSLLERPAAVEALCRALGEVDRLVILGDLLELRERRPAAEVLAVATPALGALAGAVGEIVLVPGNHDRPLITPWIRARGDALELEEEVPAAATPLLGAVVDALGAGGARVSVRYPGVRLSPRAWATHGHYLDVVLAPEGPHGLRPRPAPDRPAAYERTRERGGVDSPLHRIQARVLSPGLAPLTTRVLELQLRRRGVPALARALEALGVSAEHVIFGHLHRLGPTAPDAPRHWQRQLAPGTLPTRFLNTGSWVLDELLVGRGGRRHAYWPGGVVRIGDDGIPRADRLF
ncbi:hypothetical protein [Conexibacter sp. DBS9H8]|uniref:hypothetical protein n=1 Tax=Conexibacter sp. DBS9H8 TaxID=2937801 RepID=UPI00200F6D59|nr:hypothetical protein [Conexibacter sp. DBS9H8]